MLMLDPERQGIGNCLDEARGRRAWWCMGMTPPPQQSSSGRCSWMRALLSAVSGGRGSQGLDRIMQLASAACLGHHLVLTTYARALQPPATQGCWSLAWPVLVPPASTAGSHPPNPVPPDTAEGCRSMPSSCRSATASSAPSGSLRTRQKR